MTPFSKMIHTPVHRTTEKPLDAQIRREPKGLWWDLSQVLDQQATRSGPNNPAKDSKNLSISRAPGPSGASQRDDAWNVARRPQAERANWPSGILA